jgi:hypothetical protein
MHKVRASKLHCFDSFLTTLENWLDDIANYGRISQLGEGWHSNGNALRFWSHALYAPKEESSRCYA